MLVATQLLRNKKGSFAGEQVSDKQKTPPRK